MAPEVSGFPSGFHGIQVVAADPAALAVDAILRVVSSTLDPVTPLSRRLERAAGTGLLERLQAMGELPVGGAVVTPGGELAVPFLIHVVVQSRDEPASVPGLRRALLNGLRRAEDLGISSLALPPLGVGAGSLDAEGAARLMIDTFREYLGRNPTLSTLLITVADGYESEAFRTELNRVFPPDRSPIP